MITQELIQSIRAGNHDTELAEIKAAIKWRQSTRATLELAPGNIVHFSASARPAYLRGLPVTVVRVNQESVAVSIPDEPQYRKYAGARNCRLPNDMVMELSA